MANDEIYLSDEVDIDFNVWDTGVKNNAEIPVLARHLSHEKVKGFLELITEKGFKKFAFSDFSAFSLMSVCDFIDEGWYPAETSKISFFNGDKRIARECVIFESRNGENHG